MPVRLTKTLAILLALALLPLPGCAGKYGEQHTVIEYYPACYRPIHDLRDSEKEDTDVTVGSIFLGGFGAVLGAALGGVLSGMKPEGFIAGGVMGAFAGGLGGNAWLRQRKHEEDTKRLASYLEEIDGNISGMDLAAAAATASLQCYDREFAALLAGIRSKSIPRAAAEKRFAEITSGREEAIQILGAVASAGRDLQKEYQDAMKQEAQELLAPKRPSGKYVTREQMERYAQRRRGKAGNQAAIERVGASSQRLGRKAAEASEKKEDAMAESRRQAEEINKIMDTLADIRA